MAKTKAKIDMWQISGGNRSCLKSRQNQAMVETIIDRVCEIKVTAIEDKRREYSWIEINFPGSGISWSGSIFDLAVHLMQKAPKTTLF